MQICERSLSLIPFRLLAVGVMVCLVAGMGMAGKSDEVGKESIINPILAGFYPDPSICRVDSTYYLVNSTFAYFPGIPVFRSNDLLHWKQIGSVMDRPEQLPLKGLGVSEGIFAPAIRYSNGTFYVTCTLVGGKGNFVVTAANPAGPWSLPTWLPDVDGIDPSLFFDEDGKAYIIYNSVPPDNKPLYDGHRTIRMRAFDVHTLTTGKDELVLVNGGTDLARKPVWIEGPHIYKVHGFYYLMAAEGGTAEQHSEVVFRSNQVTGPYLSYEKNPILTQRDLDPARENPVTCTGHADLVETVRGQWCAVFLGCRPYRPFAEGFFNTGRETFFAPVEWREEWPVINPRFREVQYVYPAPLASAGREGLVPLSGNFTWRDEFNGTSLASPWIFLRTADSVWYDLGQRQGWMTMQLRPETCSRRGNPSFLGHRQQHAVGSAAARMRFTPSSHDERAGLLVFQNETHYYFLCKALEGTETVVELLKSAGTRARSDSVELLGKAIIPEGKAAADINLKIEAQGNTYAFRYAVGDGPWAMLRDSVDGTFLSTRVAGGFVGCMYALYGEDRGGTGRSQAQFDWFEYTGNDSIDEHSGHGTAK